MGDENGTGDRRFRRRDPSTDASLCGHFKGANRDWHRNTRGERCCAQVVDGTEACKNHGGVPLAKQRAKGAVVVELRNWGLNGHAELADPGLTLLKLVTQSAARCEMYARLLAEAYEAAERLAAAEHAPDGGDLLSAESARMDLERVLNTGGVGVLIGNTYAADKQAGIFATGEAVRGLAKLEEGERDRCATFAAKAVAAGLAERMVRAQEQLAGMVAQAMERTLARLGLDPQSPEVRGAVREELLALSGGSVIDGQVAT